MIQNHIISRDRLIQLPEHKLLIHCAKNYLYQNETFKINDISKDQIDWNSLFKFAEYQKMIPMLYTQLSKSSLNLISDINLKKLKIKYQKSVDKNLFLKSKLIRLIEIFSEHNVQIVPFKGVILAEHVYNDLLIRLLMTLIL